MNWLFVMVSSVLVIGMIIGVWRGAIRIAVSLVTTLVTLVCVFFATPYVAGAIAEYTPLDELIQKEVVSVMAGEAASMVADPEGESVTAEDVKRVLEAAGVTEDMLAQYGVSVDDILNGNITSEDLEKFGVSGSILDGLNGEASKEVEEAINNAEIPRELQMQAIEQAELPEIFKELLSVNNNDEVYQELGAETFAQYVGKYLAKLIIHLIAFLCAFVLITIVFRAIVFALDIVSSLPVLGFLNRLAGGAVGIVGALIFVWTAFLIITLLYTTPAGRGMYQMIETNHILKTLYEYNPIMKLAMLIR